MATSAIVDTSVLVAAERGLLDLDELLRARADEQLAMAAITASELLHGVHRAGGGRREKREAFVERAFTLMSVVPFDLDVARVHAALWATLAEKGVTVATHDLIIASTALAVGAAVVTRDRRSFPKIPRLNVMRW